MRQYVPASEVWCMVIWPGRSHADARHQLGLTARQRRDHADQEGANAMRVTSWG